MGACVALVVSAGCGEPVFSSNDAAAAVAEAKNRRAHVNRVAKAFIVADALERAVIAAECPPGPPPLGAFRIVDAEYQGEVCIGGGDPTYEVRWKLGNGETYFGQGLVVGNRLVVGFNADGAGYGVAAYDLSDDGATGSWSSAGDGAVGQESIEKLRLDPPGAAPADEPSAAGQGAQPEAAPQRLSIRGQNPNGTEYEGDLEVRTRGETTQLTWQVGEERFRGVGLVDQELFAVGWGTAEAGLGVIVYRIEDDKLHGTWALIDDERTRVENLVLR